MSDALMDAVEHACREWGHQMRALYDDRPQGWPEMAAHNRAREGMLDISAISSFRQKFPEVLRGDALDVSRAIHTFPHMPEELHVVLFLRWVPKGPVKRKAATIGIGSREFYDRLGRAHAFIAARLPAPVPRGTMCAQFSG